MSILTYQDGNLTINKNEIIFAEGNKCQSINILLQGKVDVYMCLYENCTGLSEVEIIKNSFKLFTIDKGAVLGCEGMFDEGLQQYFTFKPASDSTLYIFYTPGADKLQEVLDSHREYGAYIMASIANTIANCTDVLLSVNKTVKELEVLTENLITYFWHYKEALGFDTAGSSQEFLSGMENYQTLKEKHILPPAGFDEEFFTKSHSDYAGNTELNFGHSQEAHYYKRFLDIPVNIRKSFFGYDFDITDYHCKHGVQYLNDLQEKLKEAFKSLSSLYQLLCSKNSTSIINHYVKAAAGLRSDSTDAGDFLKLLDFIGEKAFYYTDMMADEYDNSFGSDKEYIDSIVSQAKLGNNPFVKEVHEEAAVSESFDSTLPEELRDSARKIVEYSCVDEGTGATFLTNLNAFKRLKDKFSLDDNVKRLRKDMTESFFKVYEGVIKRVIAEAPQTRLYHMFLNFGYVDENLLLPEHIISLYNAVEKFTGPGNNQVYTVRDWLMEIYDMKKDPSMNEFSMDYNDVFRDMKKRGEITEKEKPAYMANKDGRLTFEINNMIKTNHKVCYGQPSTYFPVLHKDIFVRDLDKALVTPERVSSILKKILEVDYSAFHREINYKNSKGIEKELVMMQIMPDIILMPTFGSRGIMWQEISGRNRSTPGRFILPVMTAENLEDMLVRLVGNFRWELCRTMMGVAWNDISQKSLTSEYTDYIQFYKKNKELSEDNKEKIAVQITKYRSLMRDIFTSDYEAWFNYESKGVIRLNKVSRSILYTYCPFNKEIRSSLSNHPLFSEIDTRNKIQRTKHMREVENHYKKLERSGLELDEAMLNNLKFYKEM